MVKYEYRIGVVRTIKGHYAPLESGSLPGDMGEIRESASKLMGGLADRLNKGEISSDELQAEIYIPVDR